MQEKLLSPELRKTFRRFFIVVIFTIAFAYIEAAVVVYLRAIFYPDGFAFPIMDFGVGPLWKKLLLIEIGREAATLVIIITGCRLSGHNRRQRWAYFFVIFAIWDIFYYVWLKVLLDWPASIMDWDILFLIPVAWASPVLAPIIVSLTMLGFAVIILYCDFCGRAIKVTTGDLFGFILSAVVVVGSFCIGGVRASQADYANYFYWPLFVLGEILAIGLFIKCLLRPKSG